MEIELSYAASDVTLAKDISDAIEDSDGVAASGPRETRQLDPAAIIGLVGGVIALANALMDLRERLRNRKEARSVRAGNEAGMVIVVVEATDDEIRRLANGDPE
ncbi:hypothetical protein [Micromonospora echinospora]|uniref:hypothetical protein n=1 Tax=Micromonospora echinospora TaxID=1877 RepID=UPI003A853800